MMNNIRRFESTEDIAEYIINRKIRKSLMGGFKCAEVYALLQELQVIYKEYTEQQLAEKDRLIEEQEAEINRYDKALQKERRRNEQPLEGGAVSPQSPAPARNSYVYEGKEIEIERRRLSVLLQEVEIGLDAANLKIKGLKQKLDQ